MSVHYTSAAWFIKTEIPAEKLVLLCLADSANDEGTCWPSYATMSRKCQIDRYWLMEIVGRLIAKKIIEKHPRRHPNGHRSSNSYRLLFTPHGMEGGSGPQATKGGGGAATRVVVPRPPITEPSLEPSDRRGGKAPKFAALSKRISDVQRISLERELERILESMKTIRENYGGLQTWCSDDLKKLKTLKDRKNHLCSALGLIA